MHDWRFVFLFALVILANVVEAVTGFGSIIIAIAIGAVFYDLDHLVIVLVPINLALSGYIAVRYFKTVSWKPLLKEILPFCAVGFVGGLQLFEYIRGGGLKIGYGVFVLVFSAVELARMLLVRGEDGRVPLSTLKAAAWLAFGGLIHGVYASGGPPVVYYASRRFTDKVTFRSTLSTLWLILNVWFVASHAAAGRLNVKTLSESMTLFPAVIVGIIVGEAVHHRLPERTFRLIVFALLLAAGISLLARA